ncbi:MarR family winged helix-turn-helix transcriptional regulator [Rhodococcus kronopolitis]|uniref:MarR family winged helix-turn-helix transcriptional regulator n=1 Tax=Rhodococcus kronopolitis TaxID=1460226 RepID=A0ABV9FUR3_9NOCA
MRTFALNGAFLRASEHIAPPAGPTPTRWQVLGAVLHDPLTVSGIARAMGITRQSVQRTADVLVDERLAEHLPNPAYQRATLVRPTESQRAAIRQMTAAQHTFTNRISAHFTEEELARTPQVMNRLVAVLDSDERV